MIKQVVISAGGFGKRLKPITDSLPKPMISILGKPILLWHVEQFKKHGVTEFFFTLHHLPAAVMDFFGDGSKYGVNILYAVEEKPMGSVGGIKKFEQRLDELFYFIYGDTFSLMDYTKMSDAYKSKKNPIGMQRVAKSESYEDADVAELDESGKFIKIHPKPHGKKHGSVYRMRGAFIFNKKILTRIPSGVPYDVGRDLLPDIIEKGEVFYGYESDDYSKGIDTKEKHEEVEHFLRSREKSK